MGSAPTLLTGSDLPQSQMTKYISEIQEQQVQHADAPTRRHVVLMRDKNWSLKRCVMTTAINSQN